MKPQATNLFLTSAERTIIGNTSWTNTWDVTVTDSSEIDFTLTGQQITASLIAWSIDETKLDTSVNASLDLADSALQNINSEVINDLSDVTITTPTNWQVLTYNSTSWDWENADASWGGWWAVTVLNTYSAAWTVIDWIQGTYAAGQDATLAEVNVILTDTAPTGSNLTVDVYVDWVNVWTVTVTASTTTWSQTTFSDTTISKYDEIYFDVTWGSSVAGSGLVINTVVS